ncbi:MAG: protein translocase subunit SecF [Candidatus Marinimicrobia bacterium]|jgi:preprotein translocase SecF subunit|nr:protein translocase subunit SecF [Candidatus Neomarinimicrobiota bacterium]MDP6789904.1 protein translocase subunit SecF [Candidatus Neomarinimicrobiota bacterium]MDP7071908.1 protein translocase subunit SecF [Candidatus Neomarinimicrobiota bacterium]
MRIVKDTSIDFMSKNRIAASLSIVLILAGIVSLFLNGGPRLSIDFKGGTLVAVRYTEDMDITDVRSAMESVTIESRTFDFSKEEIKHFGSNKEVSIRISHFDDEPENFSQSIVQHLYKSFPQVPEEYQNFLLSVEKVGPKIGTELSGKAIGAVLSALALILLYISIRFEFTFALGAIAALAHDVMITVGIFSILNYEISLSIIAAFLTIVGYSLNDTIVIFDRIRENVKASKREAYVSVVNRSINESLSRTLVTSLTTFMVVFILWYFGGEVIHYFAFAMIVGVLVGTYSSIFVASPIVVRLHSSAPSK